MDSLLQDQVQCYKKIRKFRKRWIVPVRALWQILRGTEKRFGKREFSEASEDFSSLEIFWHNCELVSQGEAIVADGINYDWRPQNMNWNTLHILFVLYYSFSPVEHTNKLILKFWTSQSRPTEFQIIARDFSPTQKKFTRGRPISFKH